MRNIVWLASYLKSGNTWLRTLLSNYYSDSANPLNINELRFSLKANDNQLIEKYADLEPSELTFQELECIRPNIFKKNLRRNQRKSVCKNAKRLF
jgi:aryl sulfotransferase